MIRVAALLGTVAVLAGCGSSSNATSSSRCEDVPVGMNNTVSSSLETGNSVDGFQAVRSRDHKKVWFLSAHATDPSGRVVYPTWATNDLSATGPVFVVDAASRNVTTGLSKLPGVSGKDDGVAQAQQCARDANGGG